VAQQGDIRVRVRGGALLAGAVGLVLIAGSARAQQQPTIEDLMRRIDALQKEVEELKASRAAKPAPSKPRQNAPASASAPRAAPGAAPGAVTAAAAPARPPAVAAASAVPPVAAQVAGSGNPAAAAPPATPLADADKTPGPWAAGTIPGLAPPEPMGNQFSDEDALRSDLPGVAIRVPGTQTEVRVYGFAKLSAWGDLNGRNQTDAPTAQTIPLNDSAADKQGGDFGMTARFSRMGIDTRTLTDWGTLETRLEGDFGGGSPASSNALFRLRQAWGELGTPAFRVLVGQANSLWNEGVFETLIDATNLNQSFIRQPQVRVTGRLAPGLTGMASLEAPDTQFTSTTGVFSSGNAFNGSGSPAFNQVPDLLGRLTYRDDGLELDTRALLRQLSIHTAGTALAPPALIRNTAGWGLAAHVRFPMRWVSDAFGPDQAIVMAYYGEGIGRYFAGNTSGQDALSNIGLPGTSTSFSFDAIPTYGFTAAYRRFWTTQLRSNISYSYAQQDFPSYASQFTSGSIPAVSLNKDMQQVFVNLIWSPFATVSNGVVGTGWLDTGLEYLWTRRDVLGGAQATGSAGAGHGIANRILGAAVVRF
jgi:hypothetical protein